jgi:hypothetical protein
MPSRDEELAPLIRRVFLPEEEGGLWCTVDCSQQEFRFVVHHAAIRNLPGANKAAELYRNNPDTDFHGMASAMTGLARKDAKGVNFAKIYGARVKKFAEMIGKPLSEAQVIYAEYDIRLPFMWQLSRDVEDEAVRLGYTVLYDNARRHWNLWEAVGVYVAGAGPCPHEEAMRRRQDPAHPWFAGKLRLGGTYAALNALIQGSAARHTKLWMLACWREGIVPLLQMHDGLELSVTRRELGERVAQLAWEAVKLEVPMRADIKFGRSWGDATHAWDALTSPDKHAMQQVSWARTIIKGPPGLIVTGLVPPIDTGLAGLPVPIVTGLADPADLPVPIVTGLAALARPNGAATITMSAAETIAKALGGHRTGNGWIAQCPLHDDQTPSLSISSGKNGKVLVHCHAGCNQRDVFIAVMRKRGLLGKFRRPADGEGVEDDADARKRSALALAIWRACGPANATPVQTYLAARGINLPLPDALRFHYRLKHPAGDRWPAMVALVTHGTNATPLAIHRTFLARDGSGKAPIDPQKMMLGPCRGGVVRLADADLSGRPFANSGVLMVGEGIETCLAAMQATGHPAWAALSTAGLCALDLPEYVRDVIVLADGDAAGEAAARDCARRWKRQGRRVRIARPPQGMDFNDMLVRREGVRR